jgi:3-oxoadipate enol-lactonase
MKIDINQITMYYEEQGSGLPVIFLHGYPLDHTIWSPVTDRLAGMVRLITPDLRGHGQTDAPAGTYTMRQMADDVAALMDHLKLQQAVLVGHSMGGYASLAFSQVYPDRLLGLALVASQAAADTLERREGRYITALEVEEHGMTGVVDSMSARLTSRPDLVDRLRQIILQTSPQGVAGTLRGIAERQDMTAWITSIDLPAVVIAGGEDALVPLERAQEMALRFPNARLTIIPGAGHMPMMEAPDDVSRALAELFEEILRISSEQEDA